MVASFCHVLWENGFLHYILFAILGPFLGLVSVYLLRDQLMNRFWLKALPVFGVIDIATFLSYGIGEGACEVLIFGYRGDDPGDIGVVLLTMPLFLLTSLAAIGLLYIARTRMMRTTRVHSTSFL